VVLGSGSAIILATLVVCARTQTSYWRNSELLWTHTLACTSENAVAHNDLGYALFQKKRLDEAIGHFQQALRIKPDYAEAHHNFGNAWLQKGRADEAIVQYEEPCRSTTRTPDRTTTSATFSSRRRGWTKR